MTALGASQSAIGITRSGEPRPCGAPPTRRAVLTVRPYEPASDGSRHRRTSRRDGTPGSGRAAARSAGSRRPSPCRRPDRRARRPTASDRGRNASCCREGGRTSRSAVARAAPRRPSRPSVAGSAAGANRAGGATPRSSCRAEWCIPWGRSIGARAARRSTAVLCRSCDRVREGDRSWSPMLSGPVRRWNAASPSSVSSQPGTEARDRPTPAHAARRRRSRG
jgi:hypothetical protein